MTDPQLDTHAVRQREGTDQSDQLVVLMHGFGSDAEDLFGLAGHLPAGPRVVSLPGPLPAPNGGRAWFEFDPAVDSTDHTMIDASCRAVLAWLDALAEPPRRTHLVGFSQGGAMAVQLARLAPTRFASLCHLSSFVHNGDLPGDAELAALEPRIPLLHTLGTDDRVIAADKRERSLPWLDEHFDVQRHHYRRGHGIIGEELTDIARFLERRLG